ncbi:MAG: hypothetical protein JRC86_05980 [Deltaproteobacteria bacterium]|nr:hypothetical protein [Deltaproteobacteria bacterium]
MKRGYLQALCTVFPSGETLWCEAAKKDKMVETVDRWVQDNPKYVQGGCSLSTVNIVMPKEVFENVKQKKPESVLWLPDNFH